MWDQIANALIDDVLQLDLTQDERHQFDSRPTRSSDAFDAFLKARRLQMDYTEADYLNARSHLEFAVKEDPKFAEAWIALAGTYWTSAIDGFMHPEEAWKAVGEYLANAEKLKPDLPDLHFGRALTSFFGTWKWEEAEQHYQLAVRALDSQPELAMGYALKYWALGQLSEALRIVRDGRKVDPLSPGFMLHEATYLAEQRNWDRAAALCLAVAEAHPESWRAHFTLADIRYAQRKFPEAIEARRQAHALRDDDNDDDLNETLASAVGEDGYREIVEVAIRNLELRPLLRRKVLEREKYTSPLDIARAYAQLDHSDKAFRYLDEALEHKSPALVLLNVDHAWDSIRSDTRFQTYVKQVGLPVGRSS